jgi:hypothetical protein
MQLALHQLRAHFAEARDAANALRVSVVEDRPPQCDSVVVDEIEISASDLAGVLESTRTAFDSAEGAPFDRVKNRAALSMCEDTLERSDTYWLGLESRLRQAPRDGEWAGWTERAERQAAEVVGRLQDARRALSTAWREFTEPAASAAESSPEDGFVSRIHAQTFDWYKQADAKAQAILSFTGVFLVVLVGSVVLKGETTLLRHDSPRINFVLVGTVLALYLAAAFLCVLALWARGMGPSRAGVHFFGDIANLRDGGDYLERARRTLATSDEELRGRAAEVVILSQNTRLKHRLVNAAVVCCMVALLGTVVVGMGVVVR